ncbi:MAG: metal-dependent hydrolase [Balneolaceae bacterium]
MDSITHIALGTVIGEAKLGRQLGYKAALWGAAISTLPDLDVLIYPFLDSAQELRFHRGITHSFFFLFLAPPFLGWLINRIEKKENLGWKPWTWLSYWSLMSHIVIDIPTSYGTQVLKPFSNRLVTTDSIFIIDPFFTALFISGAVIALLQPRSSRLRLWASRLSLLAGGLYLIWGLGIKVHVNQVFDSSFNHQYGSYEQLKTIPGPFTTLMWMGYIERNDSLYASTFSLFDDSYELEFQGIDKKSDLVEPYKEDHPVEVLLWFSMGYYKMEKSSNGLYLHDLRFGRSDYWLRDDADYIWSNRFIFNGDSTRVVSFDRSIPILDSSIDNRREIWRRFWGE